MKKMYLLSAGLLMASISFSQQKTSGVHGFAMENPIVTHADAPRGGLPIISVDFSGGIPANWGVSTTSGPVNWKHTTVGHTGDYPTAPLSSSTSSNGWMIVDSDADNFSGGGSEDTRLISQVMDLTGYTNIKLEFQQMFRRWQSDITTVQISVDSINWTDIVINSNITQAGTANPDYVNIDISSIVAGNTNHIWIAFWWQGSWDYGWQIDDIAMKEILDNDLIMKNEKFGTNVEYYQVPLNQVQAFDFSSDVENIGLFTQNNISLNVTVNDGTTNVYTGTSNTLTSLAPWNTDSVGIAAAYTPSAEGNYTITFEMTQTEIDASPSNNLKTKSMIVTDTIYALDNGIYQGQWYNLASGGASNEYFIGGAYDIFTNEVASSISVYVGGNTDVGTVFETVLYEWDGAGWSMVNSSDLITVTAGHLNNWIHAKLLTAQPLNAGGTYLAAVHHFGGADYFYVGYSSNTNPGYTLSSDDGITFNGQPRNPMIRLNTGSAVGIKEDVMIANSVYPNPASDLIRVDLNDNANNVNAELIDITGKVVFTNLLNANSNTISTSEVSNGVYTLRLTSEENIQTISVVVAK